MAKPKGRYQQKLEQGLVPHHYDRNSRTFSEGAWKNWPHERDETKRIVSTQSPDRRDDKSDRQFLANRNSRLHRFVPLNLS